MGLRHFRREEGEGRRSAEENCLSPSFLEVEEKGAR